MATTSRVILFSGKGGTGKTTISAATASRLAQQGQKVLIISSDPAHSLGDVLCQTIADRVQPTLLAANLYGLELNTLLEARRSLDGLQNRMENSYHKQGVTAPAAAELATQPGLDEILALNRVREEAESGQWDVIIVDTAPTGNTLRLLAYPELMVGGRSVANTIKTYKSLSKIIRAVKDEGATERYLNDVNRLLEIMGKLNSFLLSSAVTLRLVMNAEKLSLEETKRAYTFLSLYGLSLDGIIVNKLYPTQQSSADLAHLLGIKPQADSGQQPAQTGLGSYFNKWVQLQKRYLTDIENSFSPLPIFKIYLQKEEPLGVAKLADFGATIYGLCEPAMRLYDQKLIWVEDNRGSGKGAKSSSTQTIHRTLCLRIPFIEIVEQDKEHTLEISRDGSDLTVFFGRLQRKVSLPRILNDAEFKGGVYQEGILRLGFGEVAPSKPAATKVLELAAFEEDDPFRVN